jgi:hypothetical protein
VARAGSPVSLSAAVRYASRNAVEKWLRLIAPKHIRDSANGPNLHEETKAARKGASR